MNVEKGFRRLTAVASALILLAGLGAVVFDWVSSMSSWRAATAKPPGPPVAFVVGGTFNEFPEGSSEKEIAAALTHAEETFQLTSRADDKGDRTEASSKPPVSYLYLPGALPGVGDAPPGYVLVKPAISPQPWEEHDSSGSGAPPEVKPGVVRSIRERYPGIYDHMSDSDLAKAVAKKYPRLGQGRLWSRKTLLQDEARGALPPKVIEAVAKLRQKDLLPYGDKPDPRINLILLAATLGAAAVPWILFFVIRWIVRGFGSRGEH
jgi:hypothetical protein